MSMLMLLPLLPVARAADLTWRPSTGEVMRYHVVVELHSKATLDGSPIFDRVERYEQVVRHKVGTVDGQGTAHLMSRVEATAGSYRDDVEGHDFAWHFPGTPVPEGDSLSAMMLQAMAGQLDLTEEMRLTREGVHTPVNGGTATLASFGFPLPARTLSSGQRWSVDRVVPTWLGEARLQGEGVVGADTTASGHPCTSFQLDLEQTPPQGLTMSQAVSGCFGGGHLRSLDLRGSGRKADGSLQVDLHLVISWLDPGAPIPFDAPPAGPRSARLSATWLGTAGSLHDANIDDVVWTDTGIFSTTESAVWAWESGSLDARGKWEAPGEAPVVDLVGLRATPGTAVLLSGEDTPATVVVIDPHTLEARHSHTLDGPAYALDATPDGLLVGDEAGTLYRLAVDASGTITEVGRAALDQPVSGIAASADGTRALVRMDAIHRVDVATGRSLGNTDPEGASDAVARATTTDDGWVVLGGGLHLWPANKTAPGPTLAYVADESWNGSDALAVGADGKVVVATDVHGHLQSWRRTRRGLEPARDWGEVADPAVALSPTGDAVVFVDGAGRSLRVAHPLDARNDPPITGAPSRLRDLRVDPTGTRVAAVDREGRALVWSVADGQLLQVVPPVTHERGDLSPVVGWRTDGSLIHGSASWLARHHNEAHTALDLHLSDARHALVLDDGLLWMGRSGGAVTSLEGHTRWTWDRETCHAAADGDHVLLVGEGLATLHNRSTGAETQRWDVDRYVCAGDVSADRVVLVGDPDNHAWLFDAQTGERLADISLPDDDLGDRFHHLELSADARSLAAVFGSQVARFDLDGAERVTQATARTTDLPPIGEVRWAGAALVALPLSSLQVVRLD